MPCTLTRSRGDNQVLYLLFVGEARQEGYSGSSSHKGAYTLIRRLAIFHSYGPGILHLSLGSALQTIRLHFYLLRFKFENNKHFWFIPTQSVKMGKFPDSRAEKSVFSPTQIFGNCSILGSTDEQAAKIREIGAG